MKIQKTHPAPLPQAEKLYGTSHASEFAVKSGKSWHIDSDPVISILHINSFNFHNDTVSQVLLKLHVKNEKAETQWG